MDILGARYEFGKSLAIEDFDDGSLIFLMENCRLIKINHVARDVLWFMDGKNNTREIFHYVASAYNVSFEKIYQDVSTIIEKLADMAILRDVKQLQRIKDYNAMDDIKYSINQNASCRIEDSDGAILFNPENDAVQVINPTGLAIWQALDYPRKKHEIVEHLVSICEDVPEDRVVQDVEEFLQKLKTDGFIGEVIE